MSPSLLNDRTENRLTQHWSYLSRGGSVRDTSRRYADSRSLILGGRGQIVDPGGVRRDADGSLSDRSPIDSVRQESSVFPAINFTTAAASPADVAFWRRRRPRGLFFSHPIRSRKSDQTGIDGVGEHRGEHRVPESERRWVSLCLCCTICPYYLFFFLGFIFIYLSAEMWLIIYSVE